MNKEEFYQILAKRPRMDNLLPEPEEKTISKAFGNANDVTIWCSRNTWLKNISENYSYFKYFNRDHSVKVFLNELQNKPCILVGAGPSLENNVQYLQAAKQRGVFIFASSHSLLYLKDVGVEPDAVCQLDAAPHWKYLEGDYKGVPLIVDPACNHEEIKNWKGPVYFVNSAISDRTNAGKYIIMERDRIVPPDKIGSIIESAGHVGGLMLSIARTVMMANTIVFTGYDYCFSPDGKFNPGDKDIDKTYIDHLGLKHPATPLVEGYIHDIFGRECGTDQSYMGFKVVIENSVRHFTMLELSMNKHIQFINACEGGALGSIPGGLIKWYQYLRLEDALEQIKGG